MYQQESYSTFSGTFCESRTYCPVIYEKVDLAPPELVSGLENGCYASKKFKNVDLVRFGNHVA